MKSIALFILLLFSVPAISSECKGHIFFYDFVPSWGESDSQEDYWFYYAKIKDELSKKGISFSTHHKKPLNAPTCFAKNIEIESSLLTTNLGYVFATPKGKTKVVGGVLTGVDMYSMIDDLFNKNL